MFVGGRNRFDTLVKDIQCTFSTNGWCVLTIRWFSRPKFCNSKMKMYRQKTEMERNLTLFSSQQRTWLVLDHPRHLRFLYSIVKESKLLKEKFIFWIYKGFIDFLYILTSAWKKNYKMFPDLKLILVTVNILITALITRNMKFMLAFKYLAEFF